MIFFYLLLHQTHVCVFVFILKRNQEKKIALATPVGILNILLLVKTTK